MAERGRYRWWVVWIPVALLVAAGLRFHGHARAWVSDFLAPYLEAGNRTARHALPTSDYHRSKDSLVRELAELRARLEAHGFTERRLDELQRENAELRAMLELRQAPRYGLVPAQVLLRDPASGGRTLVIDRGARHGLQSGQAVLHQGNLAGRVLSVSQHGATVLSITDPNCRVSVRLAGTNHHGILLGQGENNWRAGPICEVRYLPRDVTYDAGMALETSSYGPLVPAGLPVGVLAPAPDGRLVTTIDNLYQTAQVSPYAYADESPMTFVMVVVSGAPPPPAAPAIEVTP